MVNRHSGCVILLINIRVINCLMNFVYLLFKLICGKTILINSSNILAEIDSIAIYNLRLGLFLRRNSRKNVEFLN